MKNREDLNSFSASNQHKEIAKISSVKSIWGQNVDWINSRTSLRHPRRHLHRQTFRRFFI